MQLRLGFSVIVRLTPTFLMEGKGSQGRQHLAPKPEATNLPTHLGLPGVKLQFREDNVISRKCFCGASAQPGAEQEAKDHACQPEGWNVVTKANVRGEARHLSGADRASGFHFRHRL